MKLSIVIPCYNEGNKLYENIYKINNFLCNKGYDFEIIISNDGSKDTTFNNVIRLQRELANIKFIDNKVNMGKGYAVRCGMLESSGDIVFFMDADLSTDLMAIENAIQYFNNYDIVIGSRKIKTSNIVKKQPLIRKIISKISSKVINLIIPLNLNDTQCGFKGFKKEIINTVFKRQTVNGFAFDVEILYIAKLYKFSIKEMPVKWENDSDTRVKLLRDSIKFFNELFKIRAKKYN